MRVSIFGNNSFVLRVVLLVLLFLILPILSAHGAQLKARQSIFAVKFIYVDKEGNIKRVWSNVNEKDDAYVIKFFDVLGEREISVRNELLNAYKKQAPRLNVGRETEIVEFVEKDSRLEEIITVV